MHWFPDRMIGETNLMRPDQIACIREAFDRLWPVNRRFADLFYARLFELDPTARTLFRGDLEGLKTKLLSMLATIVGAADRPEIFDSVVEDLGRRHALFGVTPAQYSAVGEALIWSLGEALGPALTRSRREAWSDFYKVVQLSMLRGAARG
jgi:hemoglobin-like flavoprotein